MYARVIVAVLLVVALGGCASAGHGSNHNTTTAHSGSVAGIVRLYGGPATAHGQAMKGTPESGYEVRVMGGGHEIASSTSDKDGRFSINLPPGSYTLAGCGVTTAVVVRAGSVTHHDCSVAVP